MRSPILSILAVLTLLAAGCGIPETVQRRSSLSAYLGAKPQPPTEAGAGPVKLQLPLRLGIAFVPADPTQVKGDAAMDQLSTSLDQGVTIFKQDLLKGVRKDVQLVDKDGNPLGSAAYDPTRR